MGVAASAQTTLTNGLVAYWAFDDNFLDSVAGFHGTPRGTAPVTFVAGQTGFAKAIQLNGVDQFVEITGGNENDLEFPGGSMSIAGWFKVDAFDTEWQALISKGEGTAYRVARRGTTDSIAYAGGRGEGPADSPPINDGNWHHFVAVTDATGTNNAHSYATALYIDGNVYEINVADPNDTNTLPVLAQNSLNLMIGENPGARNREWEGLIDDIGIWNRVLTDSEVTNLYAGGVGKALSTFLPPPAKLIFIGGIRPTSRSFTFTVSDLETSIVDPATAKLTIDGLQVPVVNTSYSNGVATFVYTRTNTPWAAGSTHNYTIDVRDTQARPLNVQSSFTLPGRWFPVADLPAPAITNQWAVRWIFNIGDLGNIPQVISAITNIGTAAFTGDYVDSTAPVINFGNTGFRFGNDVPYPDAVVNHPNWNPSENGNHFIVFAVGNIEVPEEGYYTFGVRSDDGFAFRIRGGEAISESGNGELDPVDPETVVHPDNTGDSTTRAVYYLKKGVYRVEWFFWEAGGGQGGEFYSAMGQFQNDSDTDTWTLVGDTNAVFRTYTKPGVAEPGWRAYGTAPSADALIGSLGDALFLIGEMPVAPTNTYTALFMADPQDAGGGAGAPAFPSDTPAADNYYAVRATGTLVVTEAGDYEIGFDSDDGGWMKMPGKTFTEIVKNNTGAAVLANPDEVQVDAGTGSSLTTVRVNLAAGNHPIEIGYYEMTGGSFLRGIGAKFGATGALPTLTLGPAGTYNLLPSLKLTTRPAGVEESLRLTVTKSGNNIILQWTPTGGTLQTTSSLSGTPAWTDVGTSNPATVPVGSANAFFRVQQ